MTPRSTDTADVTDTGAGSATGGVSVAGRVASRRRVARATCAVLATLAAIPLGAAWFALLLAGSIAVPLLAITPLGPAAVLTFALLVRGAAGVEAGLARALLGIDVRLDPLPARRGYWGSALRIVRGGGGFWRQVGFLALRTMPGWVLGIVSISLVGGGLELLLAPFAQSLFPTGHEHWDLGPWHGRPADHIVALAPFGVVAIVAGIGLALLVARVTGAGVRGLLASRASAVPVGTAGGETPHVEAAAPSDATATIPATSDGATTSAPAPRAAVRRVGDPARGLRIHGSVVAAIVLFEALVWASTGGGYFWPVWTLLPLLVPLGIHATVVVAQQLHDEGALGGRIDRALVIHTGGSIVVWLFLVAVWGLSGFGVFWPIWPALGLALLVGVHVLARGAWAEAWPAAERIEELTSSRDGVVDAQEAELRRIERDLHDGAQARIVALGMTLGMAAGKLDDDPEAARALVAEAQAGAQAALQELRGLARGILPPVLADRGLGAAIESLADAAAVPVSVRVEVPERLPPAVERALYFVVAESIANAAKHAGPEVRVDVDVRRLGAKVRVRVRDDGAGGADANGSGLVGLRQRVEAFDGSFVVTSPPGGPTTVVAEVPCES